MNATITEIAGTPKVTVGTTVITTPTQQPVQREISGKKVDTGRNVTNTEIVETQMDTIGTTQERTQMPLPKPLNQLLQ